MKEALIEEFAYKHGYAGVNFIKRWKNYDVYELIPKSISVVYQYLPNLLLIDGEKVRLATEEESMNFIETNE